MEVCPVADTTPATRAVHLDAGVQASEDVQGHTREEEVGQRAVRQRGAAARQMLQLPRK